MRTPWPFLGFYLALSLSSWTLRAYALSGSIDLYLRNDQLDTNIDRSSNNIAYYGAYNIGTPPRQFLGCFDTGSGDTWVPSYMCTSTVCRTHDQYNPSLSSTEQNTASLPATIQYGTGAVAIMLVYDTVSFAGINITKQGLGIATSLTYDFNSTSCDGLVGLGFQGLSSTNALPPFLNSVDQGLLDQPLFGLWLSPNYGVEPAGKLTFGATDSTKYSGSLVYHAVTQEAYWQLQLGGVTVNSASTGIKANTAIIDSGTTAIVLTTSDARLVHSKIPGAVYWADQLSWNVTCNVASLPNVTFIFDGQSYVIPPALYVQVLTDLDGNSLGACTSAIVGGGSSTSSGSVVVLGTNFLRAYYSVFKVDGQAGTAQVGFAPGVGQATVNAGGRRLQENPPLFVRSVESLQKHKWGHNPHQQQGSQQPGQ